jgi:hypothetical protein
MKPRPPEADMKPRPERLVLRAWRRFYGENPLHLLAMLGCFALVGYVVSFVYEDPGVTALLIWFVGAVIAHDLVLYPLYALADQPVVFARWARRRGPDRRPPLVPAINHVRAPVLGSLVLGLIYLPTITRHGEDALRFTSELNAAGIYRHWLLITAALFLGSAVVYAVRLGRAVRRGVPPPRDAVTEPVPRSRRSPSPTTSRPTRQEPSPVHDHEFSSDTPTGRHDPPLTS